MTACKGSNGLPHNRCRSGIGNAHAEPNIPGYHVERLNRLLVRMIAGELAGQRIEPEPGEILRSVGLVKKAGQ